MLCQWSKNAIQREKMALERGKIMPMELALQRDKLVQERKGSSVPVKFPIQKERMALERRGNNMELELAFQRDKVVEERKKNFMPVEIAIQRELAYRRKLAMLQPQQGNDCFKNPLSLQHQQGNDCSKNPLSLQVQFSCPSPNLGRSSSLRLTSTPSPSISEKKLERPISSLQCQPPKQPQPNCSNHIVENKTVRLFCKVCQVPCSSPFNVKQHFKGQKHKAKLQELELRGKDGGPEANRRHWCELCKIPCIDVNCLKQHLEGQKHKVKLQELEPGRIDGTEIANQPKWCELCKIWCSSEDNLKQHLKGKKHIIQLHSIEENKSAKEEEAAVEKRDWKKLKWAIIAEVNRRAYQ